MPFSVPNRTIHYESNVADYAEMLFNGTGFTLTFTKHPSRGLIDVYVDGVKIDMINADSGSLLWQQTWASPTFSFTNHTVRLVHDGSGGTYIDVDAIEVLR